MEAASSVASAAAQIHLYVSTDAVAWKHWQQEISARFNKVMDHASFVHPRSVAQ